MRIAEVILPLPVKSNFDYRIPPAFEDKAEVGCRVIVHFGKSKMYTGVVKRLYDSEDYEFYSKLKEIEELPDDRPVLRAHQLELFEWIAFYYF